MGEGYDKNKDKVIFKDLVKSENRYLNTEVYSYDGGANKVRILPVGKNTNPNADSNKKWIKQKGISGLSKEEVQDLISALEKCLIKLK